MPYFHNGAKSVNEKSLLKTQCWENWIYTCKRLKCRPLLNIICKKIIQNGANR